MGQRGLASSLVQCAGHGRNSAKDEVGSALAYHRTPTAQRVVEVKFTTNVVIFHFPFCCRYGVMRSTHATFPLVEFCTRPTELYDAVRMPPLSHLMLRPFASSICLAPVVRRFLLGKASCCSSSGTFHFRGETSALWLAILRTVAWCLWRCRDQDGGRG